MDDSEAPQTAGKQPGTAWRALQPAGSGRQQAFHLGPVDLSIKQGDIVFIVGENGCGKTTLIKLLLGLYAPQPGEILLNGNP
jgi:putative ATP-binding cassette transporter